MLRTLLATALMVGLTAQFGCYNTYNVSLTELAKAAEGGGTGTVSIETKEGEPVVVTENTKLGVTDNQGVYHAVSPFNFTLTRPEEESVGQLVAPDEDLLLQKSAIETGNVKLVSGTKTVLLVAAGVAAITGGVLFVTLTAEEEKGFGE